MPWQGVYTKYKVIMTFNVNKKIFKISLIVIIVIAIICLVLFIVKNNKKDPVAKEIVIFEELVSDIDLISKKARLAHKKGEAMDLDIITNESLISWTKFADNFASKRPEEYQKTRDWEKKILLILEHERKADELAKEGKGEKAQAEIEKSRNIFKTIKSENGIVDISEEMLAMYDEVLFISKAEYKIDIEESLLNLKYKFTLLKEYAFDELFDDLLAEMERAIAVLDKSLDGPDFKKAQTNLNILFEDIYMIY